jgi:hypothetical protein
LKNKGQTNNKDDKDWINMGEDCLFDNNTSEFNMTSNNFTAKQTHLEREFIRKTQSKANRGKIYQTFILANYRNDPEYKR